MGTAAITSYVNVAQLVLYAFWIFFFGLIYWLVRENHREGYPMDTDAGQAEGWPLPAPKTYLLHDGSTVVKPGPDTASDTARMEPLTRGVDPLVGPVGDPLTAGVGPGAYCLRADVPDCNEHGVPRIRPLGTLQGYGVDAKDPDPRGMPLVDAYDEPAGTIRELWIDTSDAMFRYLQAEVPTADGATRQVLVPINFARITREKVKVHALLAPHFAGVPGIANADIITRREEEMIQSYYGAGLLYAEADRAEPIF